MKILVLDLETKPNICHTWGLWDQNVALSQLIEPARVICFAAKWAGEDKIHFHKGSGLVLAAHKLLSEADVVVHYNGTKFDIPWLNSEFVRADMGPPSPYTQIDLCSLVKQTFRFPSNKLEFIGSELLGQRKADTGGHDLWVKCMAGNRQAWKTMRTYNEQDVVLTEKLYDRIRPWIRNLPNPALYGEGDPVDQTCPGCGSGNLTKEGFSYTKLAKYQRFSCDDCLRWSRGKKAIETADLR